MPGPAFPMNGVHAAVGALEKLLFGPFDRPGQDAAMDLLHLFRDLGEDIVMVFADYVALPETVIVEVSFAGEDVAQFIVEDGDGVGIVLDDRLHQGLPFGQVVLRVPAVGDVLRDAQQVFRFPRFVQDRDFPGMDHPLSPGRREDGLHRDIDAVPGPDGFPVLCDVGIGDIGREEVMIALPQDLVFPDAQQFLPGLVEPDKAMAPGILDEYHVRDIVHDAVEESLVLPQGGLDPLAFGNIGENRGEPAGRSLNGRDRERAAQLSAALLEIRRLPGQRDPAVGFDPEAFGPGKRFQHGLSDEVCRFEAGEPLEGGIDGQEPVIGRGAPVVQNDLVERVAVEHILKDMAVVFLALVQGLLFDLEFPVGQMELEGHLDGRGQDGDSRVLDDVPVRGDFLGPLDDLLFGVRRQEKDRDVEILEDLPGGLGSVHARAQVDVHQDEADGFRAPEDGFDRLLAAGDMEDRVSFGLELLRFVQGDDRFVFDEQDGFGGIIHDSTSTRRSIRKGGCGNPAGGSRYARSMRKRSSIGLTSPI